MGKCIHAEHRFRSKKEQDEKIKMLPVDALISRQDRGIMSLSLFEIHLKPLYEACGITDPMVLYQKWQEFNKTMEEKFYECVTVES